MRPAPTSWIGEAEWRNESRPARQPTTNANPTATTLTATSTPVSAGLSAVRGVSNPQQMHAGIGEQDTNGEQSQAGHVCADSIASIATEAARKSPANK